MRLIDIYGYAGGAELAYALLSERPLDHGISHKAMPTWEQHVAFMASRPFRYWLVIENDGGQAVGQIECLPTNEFGVHILAKYQGAGCGKEAVRLFLATHEPLPGMPAVRNGRWLANCSPSNVRAIEFFTQLGFQKIQETYAK